MALLLVLSLIYLYYLDTPYNSKYTLAKVSIYPIKSGPGLHTRPA